MKFAFSPAAVAKVRRELNSIIAVFYLQTGIKFALHAPCVCISASEERLNGRSTSVINISGAAVRSFGPFMIWHAQYVLICLKGINLRLMALMT
jgi:hypothetical protein